MNVANYQFSRKFRENGSDQAKILLLKTGLKTRKKTLIWYLDKLYFWIDSFNVQLNQKQKYNL